MLTIAMFAYWMQVMRLQKSFTNDLINDTDVTLLDVTIKTKEVFYNLRVH